MQKQEHTTPPKENNLEASSTLHPNAEDQAPKEKANEPSSASSTDDLKTLLEETKDALKQSQDQHMRLYAEFENFKKRATQEKYRLIETAGESFLQKILPILDDFERALQTFQQDQVPLEAIEEGVKLIHDKMSQILHQYNVEAMDITQETTFDPEWHEAISTTPVTEAALKGKIINTIEKGYLLKDKVLRHAKVIIGV